MSPSSARVSFARSDAHCARRPRETPRVNVIEAIYGSSRGSVPVGCVMYVL
jgi:hypothetical protein